MNKLFQYFISAVITITCITAMPTWAGAGDGKVKFEDLEKYNYLPVGALIYQTQDKDVVRNPMYQNGAQGFRDDWANHTVFPQRAIKQKIYGSVKVRFTITTNGKIQDIRVIKSPHEILSRAALKSILKTKRFYPGFQNDKPVEFTYTETLNFNKVK